MTLARYKLGIDDHDSPIGGCTTHFSFLLSKSIEKEGIKIIGYPRLVRLNPNIPWKTRGNAAVNLTVETRREPSEVLDIVWNRSLEYVSEVSKGLQYGRSPGVILVDESKSWDLKWLYVKAITDVVTRDVVEKISERLSVLWRGGRGVIGSLASAGFLGEKRTYELLTYRLPENWDKQREVDIKSLVSFDEMYFPNVYANVDYVKGRPLILSHGKDPILYGIRGRDPSILLEGLRTIKVSEAIEGFMIFETNQGTDNHFLKFGEKHFQSTIIEGEVKEVRVLAGGDCLLSTNVGFILVYKETGELNSMARQLIKGDIIRAYGAVKPSSTFGKIIEPERIDVLFLAENKKTSNPKCPRCGSSTESVGRNKGYRCRKCGYKFNSSKIINKGFRNLTIGTYQSRYYRHLTKPIFWN